MSIGITLVSSIHIKRKGACGRVPTHMNHAYSSDDCEVFAEALEHAWRIFLRSGRLTSSNYDIAKAALTRAILDAGESGLRNPRRLAVAACARADAYLERVRQEQLQALSFREQSSRVSAG